MTTRLTLIGLAVLLVGCHSKTLLTGELIRWEPVDCSELKAPECECHDANPDYMTCPRVSGNVIQPNEPSFTGSGCTIKMNERHCREPMHKEAGKYYLEDCDPPTYDI